MIDYETIKEKMNDSTRMIRSAYTCAGAFFIITVCVMIYVTWGLLKIRGEMKNQMVERRIIYKRERLDEQVEAREGNYISTAGIQLKMEDVDRD